MLFELNGLASIKNIQVINPSFAKAQVAFFDKSYSGDKEYTNSGVRWLELNQEDSQYLISLGDSAINSLVEISANAVTSDCENHYQNYKARVFQILGGQQASEAVQNKVVTMRGVGTIRSVKVLSENFVKVFVINSTKQGDKEVKSSRWLNVGGKKSKFFSERGTGLIGAKLQFKAKANTTKQENEGEQARYFDNYDVIDSDIVKWVEQTQ